MDNNTSAQNIIAEKKHVTVEESSAIIAEGVTVIPKGFLNEYCNNVTEILLPDTVRLIHESKIPSGITMNMPEGYVLTKEKLPGEFTCELMAGPWRQYLTLNDYAYLFLYQTGFNFLELCSMELLWDPDASVKALVEALKYGGKSSHYQKVATFIEENQNYVSIENTNLFIEAAKAAKAKKAAAIAETTLQSNKKNISDIRTELEIYCHNQFSAYAIYCNSLGDYYNEFIYFFNNSESEESYWKVLYEDKQRKVPDWVVECALAPYIKQYREGKKFEIIPEADNVASQFDDGSFLSEIMEITQLEVEHCIAPELVIPICRYASQEIVQRIIKQLKETPPTFEASQIANNYKKAVSIASEALLLNGTEAAREYAQSIGRLEEYEIIHKK